VVELNRFNLNLYLFNKTICVEYLYPVHTSRNESDTSLRNDWVTISFHLHFISERSGDWSALISPLSFSLPVFDFSQTNKFWRRYMPSFKDPHKIRHRGYSPPLYRQVCCFCQTVDDKNTTIRITKSAISIRVTQSWLWTSDLNLGGSCPSRTVLGVAKVGVHCGQTHDACAVPAIILQRKIQTNVESFILTAKLNAVSENLSFFRWLCVGNELTVMHKFCRRKIRFAGTCSTSFSYELRARKLLNWFKLQGSERLDVT